MIKKIIMVLIALNVWVASGKCQGLKSCHGADSSAISFIPMEKLSKSFAKAKEAEASDVVDVKYEWTKKWGHISSMIGERLCIIYNCDKQLIYADGHKEIAGSVTTDDGWITTGMMPDQLAGFCQYGDINKIIISQEGENVFLNEEKSEWHSPDEIILDGDKLLEEDYFGIEQIINGGEIRPSSNFDKFNDGGGSSPRDINYLLAKRPDEDFYGIINFVDWYCRDISFGHVGNVELWISIPDICIITSPLPEGGLVLFPTSDYPTPVFNYTYNEVPGDSQYLKTYKGYASLSVSQYGMDFKSSCDFTFHITRPTTPENIQRAKDLGLM